MNRGDFFKTILGISTGSCAVISVVDGVAGVNLFKEHFCETSVPIVDTGALSDKFDLAVSSSKQFSTLSSADDVNSVESDFDLKEKSTGSFELSDVLIDGARYKLLGVSHTVENYTAHEKELSDLVKRSKFVVLENFKTIDYSYFTKLTTLCKKYDKFVVHLDNQKDSLIEFENTTGFLGSAVVAGSLLNLNRVSSRRSVLKTLAVGSVGYYALTSSFYHSFVLDHLLPRNFYFSHTLDQRNVETTLRLKTLSSLLDEQSSVLGFESVNQLDGEYILMNGGNFHRKGVLHYLDNPIELKYKKKFYDTNYGLFDNDKITHYKFNNNKKFWERILLNT